MKHILIYCQYFYPETFRINDLALALKERGYKVSVVSGIPNYPEGKFFEGYGLRKKRREIWNGIAIYRIPIIPRGSNSIQLILNYISFIVSGRLKAYDLPKDFDLVFTYQLSPVTMALPGIWQARRFKKKHLLYVLDLWPDNVLAVTKTQNKSIKNILNRIVDYIYKHSTRIFASSQSFVDSIAARGVSREKLIYWPQFAENLYEPKDPDNDMVSMPNFSGRSFVFAGNIGEAQGLHVLPKAAKILQEQGVKIKFVIIGDGRYKAELLQLVKDLDVPDYFFFIDRQPAEKIPYYLAKCDVAMITLDDDEIFNKTIPAKVQSLMACGMPLLVSANGEVEQIVTASKTGLTSEAGDPVELAENLLKYCQMDQDQLDTIAARSLDYHKENFSKAGLMDKFIEVIEENT